MKGDSRKESMTKNYSFTQDSTKPESNVKSLPIDREHATIVGKTRKLSSLKKAIELDESLEGEILEYSYDNPHGMLKFKADDKTWTVVLAPPSRMQSRGLEESMLSKGVKATVVGYPHLKIEDEMRAERITIGDKTTELR